MDLSTFRGGTIVFSRYRIIEEIGAGSFGRIFSAEDTQDSKKVALKIEYANTRRPQLEGEYKVYSKLQENPHFPKVYEFGRFGDWNVLVMELLGRSVENNFQHVRGGLSTKTVLMIADQMLSAVEYLHRNGFIHRDLKPDNFVFGLGKHQNSLYLIDFGLAKPYRNPTTNRHIVPEDGLSLVGTARYASINALRGIQQSRRDDMESLGYIWMYLLRGGLPWQGLPARTIEQKNWRILSVKEHTPPQILCNGFPSQFVNYFLEVKTLGFTQEPNYSKYRQMFRDLMIRSQVLYDYKYEWTGVVRPPSTPRKNSSHPTPRKPNTHPATPEKRQRKSLVSGVCQWQEGSPRIGAPYYYHPTPSPRVRTDKRVVKTARNSEEHIISCEKKIMLSPRFSEDQISVREKRRVLSPRQCDEIKIHREKKKVMTPRNKKLNKIRNFPYRRIPIGVLSDAHLINQN